MGLACRVPCVRLPQQVVCRGGELHVVVHLLSGIEDLPMKVSFVLGAQGAGSRVDVH